MLFETIAFADQATGQAAAGAADATAQQAA